jgi:Ni/Co efflux regulator RcnB
MRRTATLIALLATLALPAIAGAHRATHHSHRRAAHHARHHASVHHHPRARRADAECLPPAEPNSSAVEAELTAWENSEPETGAEVEAGEREIQAEIAEGEREEPGIAC